jgi:UDP-N-acetylglucosamine--N-acetylmuramyl-(pentapeptide) pyrophosphoryl-undecaprenol N-acetylglucosamine transferase
MEAGLVGQTRGLFATYDAIQAGPLNGVRIPRRILSLARIGIGILQTLRLIAQYRPFALFITGGFVTFPVAVACWLRRVPIAIYLPDIEPGQAIKATAALAKIILVTTHESDAFFKPGKTIETGYPLRADLLNATRQIGVATFGLDPARKTLLVFGGSRGARSINAAVTSHIADILALGVQVIHVSGERDWPSVKAILDRLAPDDRQHYHVQPYLHGTMGFALAAADLAVSRAGASALGELPFFGLPAILIPYPYAWRYQKVNADFLVNRGAAIRIDDERLSSELVPLIKALLTDSDRLSAMQQASASLARPDGAKNIAAALLNLRPKGAQAGR